MDSRIPSTRANPHRPPVTLVSYSENIIRRGRVVYKDRLPELQVELHQVFPEVFLLLYQIGLLFNLLLLKHLVLRNLEVN